MAWSGVTGRKVSAEQNKTGKGLRFTPDDIIRAVAALEAAGLQVYGVEITPTSTIKISTKPPRRKMKSDASASASPPKEKEKAGLRSGRRKTGSRSKI